MSFDNLPDLGHSSSSFPITLSARPLPPSPGVPLTELELRISRVRTQMTKSRLDVIVLTDPKNIQYFTDFRLLGGVDKTRPNMAILTHDKFIFIGSLLYVKYLESLHVVSGVTYSGYLAEAVDALGDQLATLPTLDRKRIGIDYGQDMLGYGSLQLIDRIKELSSDRLVESAVDVLWRVRLLKTPFEAEMRKIGFEIINSAFDKAILNAYAGISEFELYQIMQAQVFLNGAETSDPIPLIFSDGDFSYCRWPSERRLRKGHYIWTDFLATYGGYPTDRNRIARCGEPSAWELETYKRVRSVTIEIAKSIRPGLRCCDVYGQFQRLWKEADLGQVFGLASRIGHGGGLDATEPPSISATDETIIEEGMIFHVEPKLEKNGAVFQFEEVVYIQKHGVEFLSELSPEHLPIIPG